MTGPGSSPSTGPDLAALRDALDTSGLTANVKTIGIRVETANDLLAVLSLVDDLRAENERLRKGLTRLRDYGALGDEFVRMLAETTLAGSPAANEEQQ